MAILGAGLSGLACAITLEKNGISPVIFENRSQVGDRFINGEVLLSILNHPYNDALAYLSDTHGIFLQPVGNIGRMLIHSEHKQALITGALGFSNLRGRTANSFEKQQERQVKSKIIFRSKHTYEELLKDFTHVVLATGDGDYAAKLLNYRIDLTTTLKGATVEGKFDRYTVAAWLDNCFAPKGYGYLIPLSEQLANIVIAYPDYPENTGKDIGELWEKFFSRLTQDLKQKLRIKDRFEITKYIIGICQKPRLGNTFFVGNCFGSIMPLAGFGQFAAILTGIYAAHDLCGLGSYEELTGPLRKSYENSLVLRRAIEQLDNSKLDLLVQSLNGKLGSRLLNSRVFAPLKIASYLLRPWVRGKL